MKSSKRAMNTTPTAVFGARVKEYRKRLRMLQKELAERAGLSRTHVNRIEKGSREPPHVEALRRMVGALRLTRGEAEELMDVAGLSPLVLENMEFEDERQGLALVEEGDGRVAVGQPTQKASQSSTVYGTPLSPSQQKILTHRLAVLAKNMDAAEKNLRDAQEELHEVRALAAEMLNKV